ncbi:MAG TPA: hypothetical protein VK936_07130 [Longimicrobiales bacterium]|nr:hypothetical protein [Longimicrobiales bacterium]
MITIRSAAMAAIATTLFAGPLLGQEQFRWNGRVAQGGAIEIKGMNGGINAVAATGDEVRVQATKRGRRSDPADVRIEVLQHSGGVTICAVYPTPGGEPANECRPGSAGRSGVRNNDVQVEWNVEVPRGVNFIGRTVNGGIDGRGLPAGAEGRTVNGGVRLAAAGVVRASSVNGAVDVTMGRSDWTDRLELETVNGALTVRFTGALDADVSARTVNGAIETDYPLEVRGRFNSRNLTGVVGSGGRELALKTVNGAIRLVRQ